jgi:hypothetical protein
LNVLSEGELVVSDSVTIVGLGVADTEIRGHGSSRLFHVDDGRDESSIDVRMSEMTLADGEVAEDGGAVLSRENLTLINVFIVRNTARGDGGGIAVYSPGRLTVENSQLSQNTAAGDGAKGGAIFVEQTGATVLHDTTLQENHADGDGGGMAIRGGNASHAMLDSIRFVGNTAGARGGGLFVENTGVANTTAMSCHLTGNQAADGGGLFLHNADGSTQVLDCQFSDNEATSDGGGAYLLDESPTGGVLLSETTLERNRAMQGGGVFLRGQGLSLTAVTVAGNVASDLGGGVAIDALVGPVTILNSTLSGNQTAGNGGGVHVRSSGDGAVTIESATITQNVADDGHSDRGDGGGVFVQGSLELTHAIVAANIDRSGQSPDIAQTADAAIGGAFCLIGDNRGSSFSEANPDENGNIVGGPQLGIIDPRLSPLDDHGGKTHTHSLRADSPAINSGAQAHQPPLLVDQRQLARVIDRVDIGAVEVQRRLDVGDYDENGVFDCFDLAILGTQIRSGTYNHDYDLSDDGLLDADDVEAWLAAAGAANLPNGNPYLMGDANLDGRVDPSDLGIIGINWQSNVDHYCEGDFDGDAFVGAADLNYLAMNWRRSAIEPAVAKVARPADENRSRTPDCVSRPETTALAAGLEASSVEYEPPAPSTSGSNEHAIPVLKQSLETVQLAAPRAASSSQPDRQWSHCLASVSATEQFASSDVATASGAEGGRVYDIAHRRAPYSEGMQARYGRAGQHIVRQPFRSVMQNSVLSAAVDYVFADDVRGALRIDRMR